MHFGFFIGLDRKKQRLIISIDSEELEDFACRHKIEPKDIIGPFDNLDHASKVRKVIVNKLLEAFHGSSDPRVVGATRNTSLFEMRGPAMGDFGGEVPSDIDLQTIYFRLQEDRQLPVQELIVKNHCFNCNKNLPEPDIYGGSFGGIKMGDGKLLCFNCYKMETIN